MSARSDSTMSWRGSECTTGTRGGWRVEHLTVASIQTGMDFRDKKGNLAAIPQLVAKAAANGAQLILLPEAIGGYSYSSKFWEGAEPQGGVTTRMLCDLGREHRIHVGASILEARGEHFYNVFVLAGPNGDVLGEVFKRTPCALEALYFRGATSNTVGIDCPALGIRVAVSICYDNQLSFSPNAVAECNADILLMPHCAPFVDAVPQRDKDQWIQGFKKMPKQASAMLGIPVILANHGGPFGTPILGIPFTRLPSPFMGMSQIVQARGDTVAEAGAEAGVVLVGEITVQARGTAKRTWEENSALQERSRYSAYNMVPPLVRLIFEVDESIFSTLYSLSWTRRRAALKISGDQGTTELAVMWGCMAAAAGLGYAAARVARR